MKYIVLCGLVLVTWVVGIDDVPECTASQVTRQYAAEQRTMNKVRSERILSRYRSGRDAGPTVAYMQAERDLAERDYFDDLANAHMMDSTRAMPCH